METARSLLARRQARYAPGRPPSSTPARVVAQEAAERREAETEELPSGWLRNGKLLYEPHCERRRLAETKRIIDRVAPGPHEDGVVFERLAREAASVEWFLYAKMGKEAFAARRRIIFGTTSRPGSHAGTTAFQGVSLIGFSAGLLGLVDVLATAVTSAAPYDRHEGNYHVFLTGEQAVRDYLSATPEISQMIAEFFRTWLVDGVIMKPDYGLIAEGATGGYSLLRASAERFVVAHEYCHALADKMAIWPLADSSIYGGDGRVREIRADLFATRALVESFPELDGTSAVVALRGGTLAMKAHELLDDALSMIRGTQAVPAPADYLSFRDRSAMLQEAFRSFCIDPNDSRDDPEGIATPAMTADLVWRLSTDGLRAALTPSSLHPMWRRSL